MGARVAGCKHAFTRVLTATFSVGLSGGRSKQGRTQPRRSKVGVGRGRRDRKTRMIIMLCIISGRLLNAAPQHTADEEESLFPRMRAAGAMTSLDALESDHRISAAAHDEVDALGRCWLEAGSLPAESVQRVTGLLKQLADTYAGHIAMEDSEVFPAARRVLSNEALAAVGREMKNRRTRSQMER